MIKKLGISGLTAILANSAIGCASSSPDWEDPVKAGVSVDASATPPANPDAVYFIDDGTGSKTFYVRIDHILANVELPDSVKGIYFAGTKSRSLDLAKNSALLNGRALVAMVGDNLSDLATYANGDNIIDSIECRNAQAAAQLQLYMKHKGAFLDDSDIARYDKDKSGQIDTIEEVLTALRVEYGASGIAFDSDNGVRLVYDKDE